MASKKKVGKKEPSVELPRLPIMRLREFLQIFHDTNEYAPDNAFCFIIGSGASLTANIPTGASLVNRWLVEMHDMDDACQKRILQPHARIEDYADALLEGETERLKTWAEKYFADLPGFKFADRAKFYGHIYNARFAGDPTLEAVLKIAHSDN